MGATAEEENPMKNGTPRRAKEPTLDANTAYRKQLQMAKDQLMALTHHLEMRDEARQKPGSLVLWDQVGSIIHVNEILTEIREFLGIPTDERPVQR
jgi:hypothetical protein